MQFGQTLREAPADAEIQSHKLLIRAAHLRRVAAGIYAWLPLGLRVLRNIENIIREEMNAHGGVEILMPALMPRELLERSGRWETFGYELYRLKDLSERDWFLGPTHEECVTFLGSSELPSYRDLPAIPYQIQWKYRYAPRPRGGLLRGREFLMKDAYSFDVDEDALAKSYEQMERAYKNIFARCGIATRMIEAQAGVIGGSVNHEFVQPADAGEDTFVSCDSCDYAANTEAAVSRDPKSHDFGDAPLEELHTPNMWSVTEVAALLGCDESRMLKALFYRAGDEIVCALVPGDRELNDYKLAKILGGVNVELITDTDFVEHGWPKGYLGPVKLEGVRIFADGALNKAKNMVGGANKADYHLSGITASRDFTPAEFTDLVVTRDGDKCSRCDKGILSIGKGIEVGHIFRLGTKYSAAMDALYTTPEGDRKPYVMGCYGLGVSRVVASIVEVHNDDRGISWPRAIAPYEVAIIILNDAASEAASKLASELGEHGVTVTVDDRKGVSAGVKFADADLIGYPLQLVAGKTFVADGTFEAKVRRTGDRASVPPNVASIQAVLETCP